jgi:PqqD family protein of HPr-rel-A system
MKWRAHSPGRIYDAGESTVVYFDSHSGDTHLLSDFAGYIMQTLTRQPMTTEELVTQLAPSFEPDEVTNLSDIVTGVLDELVHLDILAQA